MLWDTPPVSTTTDGSTRNVGFELEFTGVSLESIGEVISSLYGGKHNIDSQFQQTVQDTEFGDFTLEVDSIQLKEKRYLDVIHTLGLDLSNKDEEAIDHAMYDLSKIAVPFELVTPPIPLDKISKLSGLNKALFEMQAKGTRASFLYGFGMQFNPELPSLDAETILRYLRAFFLLEDWLKSEINVDITRRILPFINNFGQDYILKVLQPDYAPSLEQLIDDYLKFNPTRNRPLDLTCLFAHIDKERTFSKLSDYQLVKPRPTFHYRLPDCRIDEEKWSMALEWNRWVAVERLAYTPERIEELSEEYIRKNETYLTKLLGYMAAHDKE